MSPINQRRLKVFLANRRGYWSLWLFGILFFLSLFAELIANDKPLIVSYSGHLHFPALRHMVGMPGIPETEFGGEFATEAEYRDEFVAELIREKGWMLWPPVRYSYRTINYELPSAAPSFPTSENWFGTDDQGRDVVARLIYGFRISVLFGLVLTFFSSIIGIIAGAVQGYYGGKTDLFFSTVHGNLVGYAPTLPADHPGQFCRTEFLVAFADHAALQLDGIGRCGAGRISPRTEPRVCSCGPGIGNEQPPGHVPAHPAKCTGGNDDLPSIYPIRIDYYSYCPGLSWFRAATGFSFFGRVAGSGKGQSACTLAGYHRFYRVGASAQPSGFHW